MLHTLISGLRNVFCYDASKRVFSKLKLSYGDILAVQNKGASWRALM